MLLHRRPLTVSDAHHRGVLDGVILAEKYEKASSAGGYKHDDFAIYVATQETSDGLDRLYFLGTVDGIVEKLKRVPEIAGSPSLPAGTHRRIAAKLLGITPRKRRRG